MKEKPGNLYFQMVFKKRGLALPSGAWNLGHCHSQCGRCHHREGPRLLPQLPQQLQPGFQEQVRVEEAESRRSPCTVSGLCHATWAIWRKIQVAKFIGHSQALYFPCVSNWFSSMTPEKEAEEIYFWSPHVIPENPWPWNKKLWRAFNGSLQLFDFAFDLFSPWVTIYHCHWRGGGNRQGIGLAHLGLFQFRNLGFGSLNFLVQPKNAVLVFNRKGSGDQIILQNLGCLSRLGFLFRNHWNSAGGWNGNFPQPGTEPLLLAIPIALTRSFSRVRKIHEEFLRGGKRPTSQSRQK